MKNISIKGIFLALLAIVVLDVLAALVAIPLFSEESTNALYQNNYPLLWSLVAGTLTTVLGGYIAASFGKLAPYKNSAIIALIGVVLGVLLAGEEPLWFDVIGFIIVIPAALLGGYIVARKNA